MTARARRTAVAALAAVGLAAGTATAVGATPRPAHHDTTGTTTVTLITGDRVVLHDTGFTSVQAGPGRERVGFHTVHRDGRLHVIPHDAAKAVANGRLDARLFDVTGLVEAGYDDVKRDTVPLIVTGDPSHSGARITRALPAADAVAAQTPKSGAATTFRALLDDPGVKRIWLDGLRQPSLDRSTAQIGAPTAWEAGYTGEGVKVAVLDTGVDQTHPDLAGREIAEHNFTDDPDATDRVGHGTHVAATIASNGPRYRGVAPDARILDGKVCVDYGCAESWILAGLHWAADQGADVVNVSLGGTDSPGLDPLEEAVNTLSARTGALFVVAAGNSGRPGTVGSPGSADAALTVGAVDRNDGIAPFSSRGPRVGDGGVKPDITAPGVDIVAAKAAAGRIGIPVDEHHVASSGTSMATPHVAGAAALIAQQHPDWTGARIKATLMASARNNPALTAFDQGTGRVDLAKALTTTVTSEPTSLAFGFHSWPHEDDTPVTLELTYRNHGPGAVTFPVSIDAEGPDGAPAPAGLFTVTPTTVTVSAGGEAGVTVTADPQAGADGAFSGTVVAGDLLRTPVGVDREPESYDVTATFLDANGRAPTRYSGLVIGMDNDVFTFFDGADNTARLRLPKGEYLAYADVTTGDPADGRLAVLPRPSLTVAGPTALAFDARAAEPVRVTAPDPDPTPVLAEVRVSRGYQGTRASIGSLFVGGFTEGVTVASSGPDLPADQLDFIVASQSTGTPVGATPVHFRFAWIEHGRVPTGFVREPARRDLAEVRSRLGPAAAGHEYALGAAPVAADGSSPMGVLFPVPTGGEAIDYLTGDDFRWHWLLSQHGPDGRSAADYSVDDRTYRDGRTHVQRFNFPVFGPGLPPSRYEYLSRLGDVIQVQVPLLNDGANNLGGSVTESARATLYRDGQKIAETPSTSARFTVPPGAGRYRLDLDLVRAPAVFDLTSRVTGSWTFRSDTVTGGQSRKLPLSVVRFTPRLDTDGSTPTGRLLRIPLTVEQQQGADNGRVHKIEVEVSFNDGKTWTKVPVVGGAALLRNTDQPGFASLRAKGTDSKGNTFEHTVIRAYKIG